MNYYPISLDSGSSDEENEEKSEIEVYKKQNIKSLKLASEIHVPETVTSYLNDGVDSFSGKRMSSILKKLEGENLQKIKTIEPLEVSKRKKLLDKKKEKEKTKGQKWFNLPATEMTEEKKNDLEIIQMRSILDPKRFYKKNDMKVLPKYFQVGTIIDSPVDYYSSRIPKKERKKTLVDELMSDAHFQRYNKKKFLEIQERKQKHSGFHKHSKRLKKNK
ncbi:deoxynucleotidyltransferase terminal-interacting protein 2-like [Artemia franciscana]|uniref:Fcf2 pre-rRNA processing C-terminal domain-containing protein n=1 Tax=Artemia franciscana TaxID=6661 RepID=A0AA88H5F7_ARTSF|nr:hypothetical protein QYM36_017350 [Artemia franciscana]